MTDGPEARAARLVPTFAGRAAHHDAEGTFPTANLDDLRSERLTGLTVPTASGGEGAHPRAFSQVTALIAEGCPATALLFTMHAAALAQIGRDGRPDQRERLFRDAVAGQIFGIAYSDSAASEGASGIRARAIPGGWRLDGRKSFVTGAAVVDAFVATVVEPEQGEFKLILPSVGIPGIRIAPTWDALGMRASASDDLYVEGVELPEEARLGGADAAPDPRFQPNGIFALGFAATSVGIAAAALNQMVGACRRRIGEGAERVPPSHRSRLADAWTETAAARALLDRAAAALEQEGEAATGYVNAAKLFANRAAITVADLAMQTIGGRAYLRPHPIERLYRDARAGLLMRNSEDQCRDEIARAALEG